MKGILEFDLPEEQYEFDCATNASKLKQAMFFFYNTIRAMDKHGHSFNSADEAVAEIRTLFNRYLNEYDVSID